MQPVPMPGSVLARPLIELKMRLLVREEAGFVGIRQLPGVPPPSWPPTPQVAGAWILIAIPGPCQPIVLAPHRLNASINLIRIGL